MVMTNLLMNARDSLVARFVASGVGIFFFQTCCTQSLIMFISFKFCPVLTGNKPMNFRPTDECYFYTLEGSNLSLSAEAFLPAIFVVTLVGHC